MSSKKIKQLMVGSGLIKELNGDSAALKLFLATLEDEITDIIIDSNDSPKLALTPQIQETVTAIERFFFDDE